ncbi:hypothetical protein FPV67DRAFT_1456578 [Lyophyllum atratum]|nr:hypothetical protein FPV67DRAFT_1456578 [Lyophyllum atratum]
MWGLSLPRVWGLPMPLQIPESLAHPPLRGGSQQQVGAPLPGVWALPKTCGGSLQADGAQQQVGAPLPGRWMLPNNKWVLPYQGCGHSQRHAGAGLPTGRWVLPNDKWVLPKDKGVFPKDRQGIPTG